MYEVTDCLLVVDWEGYFSVPSPRMKRFTAMAVVRVGAHLFGHQGAADKNN